MNHTRRWTGLRPYVVLGSILFASSAVGEIAPVTPITPRYTTSGGQYDYLISPETRQAIQAGIDGYVAEFGKLYGPNGVVAETTKAAIEKAKPIIDAYVAQFNKTYVGSDSDAAKIIRLAIEKSKPVVDAYVREFNTMYVGSDSQVAQLARQAMAAAKPVVDGYAHEFNKMYVGRDSTVAKYYSEYEQAFRKMYIGPDSQLSEVTRAAIEKSKPVVEAYIQEFNKMYVGKDSTAAQAIDYALKKAKPVVDAYINEFNTMYIGNDSTVANLAREAMKQAGPIAQAYGHEFKKMYVGKDSTAAKAIGTAIEKTKPLLQAYGHEFKKMYIGKDATAWRTLRNAGNAISTFANENILPTLRDWLGWNDEEAPDTRFQNPPLSPLMALTMGDEEKPVSVGGGEKPQFAYPAGHAKTLIQNGSPVNEVDPRRLVVMQQPDGFSVAAYGLTPAGSAGLTCNPQVLESLVSQGADVLAPVVIGSIYDTKAISTLSAQLPDLIQFRIFILNYFIRNTTDEGQREEAKKKLTRCEAALNTAKRAMGIGGAGPYSVPGQAAEHYR